MRALPPHPFDSGPPRKRRIGYSAPALSSDHSQPATGLLRPLSAPAGPNRSASRTRTSAEADIRSCGLGEHSGEPLGGVSQPRILRGRLLSSAATAVRSSAVCTLRSLLLGKYWRSRPLVFSLEPRCHGLAGSQK